MISLSNFSPNQYGDFSSVPNQRTRALHCVTHNQVKGTLPTHRNHMFPRRDEPMRKYIALISILILAALAVSVSAMTSEPPAVGAPAPAFKLVTNEGKEASLSDFQGQWVVLYFYPKDFTSGCTLRARSFQRDLEKYKKAGAVILGVSVDTAESHKDFCAKEGLNFKLLADIGARVSEQYGSVME